MKLSVISPDQSYHKNGNDSSFDLEKRRYERISAPNEIKFSTPGFFKGFSAKAKTVNMSQTGVCLEIRGFRLVKLGTEVKLKVSTSRETSIANLFRRKTKISGVVTRTWRAPSGSTGCAVRFERPIREQSEKNTRPLHRLMTASFITSIMVTICFMKYYDFQWFWYGPVHHTYSILAGFFFVSRVWLAMCYREPKDKGYMPPVSLIISVKNEEAHMAETVERCFKVRYPKHLMEVIVIDDGSTDNTWNVLQNIKPLYPKLKLFQFPENRGKRHGMALGAEEASGDVLIYVDSDSYLEEESIYRIVQPFKDSRIGAVAGHTRVIVEKKNLISKMEAVRYYVSHQLFKTAESLFGAVSCCPGAFSAYRREAVLRVLPVWLNQMFLGEKATFGDDRSLTNHILRTHKVVYHANANCVTYVPDTWKKFFTQQLRWKKSWVRETTIASQIMYKKHPIAAISYYIGIIVTFLSPLVFLRATLYSPAVLGASPWPYILGVLLVYLFLCFTYLHETRKSHWYCGLIFAVLYLTILCWQTYYAVMTVKKNHWGTR